MEKGAHSPSTLSSFPAATPPNLVDRPCLRLKVYVRPTSKCQGYGKDPGPLTLPLTP